MDDRSPPSEPAAEQSIAAGSTVAHSGTGSKSGKEVNSWSAVSPIAEFVASVATIVALFFVAKQLCVEAQSSRVQAWAFLLDTSNNRWSAYSSACSGKNRREITFALGELLNFFEVLAREMNRRRLPSPIVEQIEPYLVDTIALMSRDDQMADEIRVLRVNDKTFSDLRLFSVARINKFGDYPRVARLFAPLSAEVQ